MPKIRLKTSNPVSLKLRKNHHYTMDKVQETFNEWATNGRSELMEKEHQKNVEKFLSKISFERPFSFLDIGCGNGWTVRKIASLDNCKKAVGIDKSNKMIKNAKSKSRSKKEHFIATDLESWKYQGRFDYIFAMESIYYSRLVQDAVNKAYRLLKKEGWFFCGTDFYKDNKATSRWSNMMNIPMHLLSKSQWREIFNQAGFKTKTIHVKDPKNTKKWKREFGTLFIMGEKTLDDLS